MTKAVTPTLTSVVSVSPSTALQPLHAQQKLEGQQQQQEGQQQQQQGGQQQQQGGQQQQQGGQQHQPPRARVGAGMPTGI